MYSTVRTITAKAEPVTLDDLKNYLNTVYTDDDNRLIPGLLKSARQLSETFTNRALIAQTIEYTEVIDSDELDYQYVIKLPYPDHSTIEEVKVNGVAVTDYVKTGSTRLSVYLTGLTANSVGACEVYVKYKCPGTCIDGIKTAIMCITKDMYENRGKDQLTENGMIMLMPYKIYW